MNSPPPETPLEPIAKAGTTATNLSQPSVPTSNTFPSPDVTSTLSSGLFTFSNGLIDVAATLGLWFIERVHHTVNIIYWLQENLTPNVQQGWHHVSQWPPVQVTQQIMGMVSDFYKQAAEALSTNEK